MKSCKQRLNDSEEVGLEICSSTVLPIKPINNDLETINIQLGTLAEMELQLINAVMDSCQGNKTSAVSLLKISRTTLWKKLSLGTKSKTENNI